MEKKHPKLEELRKNIPQDVKDEIDALFYKTELEALRIENEELKEKLKDKNTFVFKHIARIGELEKELESLQKDNDELNFFFHFWLESPNKLNREYNEKHVRKQMGQRINRLELENKTLKT
jgi:ABC-type phosphate transport system auxiliary subunit